MTHPFIDTNVFIRLLTGDDPAKQEAARRLFEQVEAGILTVRAPDTVIADVVFVLSSRRLYHLSRIAIRDGLVPLLRLPNLRLPNRRILVRALDLYAKTKLDFGDVMLLAAMERAGAVALYSWDEDFDAIPAITRLEPPTP